MATSLGGKPFVIFAFDRRQSRGIVRILLAGAALQEGWVGGEPEGARQLARGLAQAGMSVEVFAQPRAGLAAIALGISPLDFDPVSVSVYRKALQRLRPDIVLSFYDYDLSLIRACKGLGLSVIACVHMHWAICPIGTLYIDGPGICRGAELGKCVSHMMVQVPPTRLSFDTGSLPFPLAFQVYLKSRGRIAALNHADAIVVPSDSMRSLLERSGAQRVHVIHSALDPRDFRPRTSPSEKRIVLFPSGSSVGRKGLDHFSRVACDLGPSFPNVRFMATNSQGNRYVSGTEFLSRAEYVELMLASELAVIPPLWSEPFGMVALEAMAAGLPVVGYSSGALPEIVESGVTGLLSPPGDLAGLSRNVRLLLEDRDRGIQLGRAGRLRAANEFGVERMTRAYVNLIHEVLDAT